MKEISISILSGDILALGKTLSIINEIKLISYIHLDVMDGNFVPDISFGYDISLQVKQNTNKKIDTHLMVANPMQQIDRYFKISDIVTIHFETISKLDLETLKQLKNRYLHCKMGLAIKPSTQFEEYLHFIEYFDVILIMTVEPGQGGQKLQINQVKKVFKTSEYIKKYNLKAKIQVDGGINESNILELTSAGSEIFVIGSYLLDKNGLNANNLKTIQDYFI